VPDRESQQVSYQEHRADLWFVGHSAVRRRFSDAGYCVAQARRFCLFNLAKVTGMVSCTFDESADQLDGRQSHRLVLRKRFTATFRDVLY